MTIRRLDHVQLAMPPGGEAKARTFYRDLPGIPERIRPPHLAVRSGWWLETDACRYERPYVDDPFGNRIELMR